MQTEEDLKKAPLESKEKTAAQTFWELVRFALIAAIIVFPIRWFVVDPFVVSGLSMFPTFHDKDYLIVDELSYELRNPERYDVVIFQYPGDPKNNPSRSAIARFFDPGKYYIKRVIGLPSETVDIKGNTVTITNSEHKDGFKLDQSFVKDLMPDETQAIHYELKGDEYFVMGDNRPGSSDSRYWGPVKRIFFTGRALLRLLPVNNVGILPGNYK